MKKHICNLVVLFIFGVTMNLIGHWQENANWEERMRHHKKPEVIETPKPIKEREELPAQLLPGEGGEEAHVTDGQIGDVVTRVRYS